NGQAPFIPQGWAAIVAAQQQVVAAHANMAFAATAFGLEQLDGGHYTGASRAWQAADVATAALSLMGLQNLSFTNQVGTSAADTLILSDMGVRLDAGNGDDVVFGGAGDDIIRGNFGSDLILGGLGRDILSGGYGNDTLYAGAGQGELHGDAGNDLLTNGDDGGLMAGGLGVDTLLGGSGADTLDGGTGADVMAGGQNDDTYYVDNIADQVVEYAGEGFDTVISSLAAYTLTGTVEAGLLTGTAVQLTGNDLNNSLKGSTGANLINGGAGADTLDGGGGVDTLVGGTGDDTYIVSIANTVILESAGGGFDTIQLRINSFTMSSEVEALVYTGAATVNVVGNAQNNLITGATGGDTLDGGGGADTLIGGLGGDFYTIDDVRDVIVEELNAGGDTVRTALAIYTLPTNVDYLIYTGSAAFYGTGNALGNQITGGGGADTLDGGSGVDKLTGGAGNDLYLVESTGDQVVELAGGGLDTVQANVNYYLLGAEVENLTFVFSGNASGVGNVLNNVLTGGNGADTLDGGLGADTLAGGLGADVYVVDNAGDLIVEREAEGIDLVRTVLTTYALSANVDNLTYTGGLAFAGQGNGLGNAITSGAGADTLDGGLGADTLTGGLGDDVYVVDNPGDVVIENTGAGIDLIRTTVGSLTLASGVDLLTYVGTGDFRGVGNMLANTLTGGAGADTLDGGAGADRLIGGLGDDTYVIDATGDVVVEAQGGGNDTQIVSLSVFTIGANIEALTYSGTAAFQGIAGSTSALIRGGSSADTLTGGAGADTLDGGAGADSLLGGAGDDVYVVDNLGDKVVESAAGGTDTVRTTLSSYGLGLELETLIYVGSGPFNGSGNAANNRILGSGLSDSLSGGAGADTLDGGTGADLLTGGSGDDLFLVDNTGDVLVELSGGGLDEAIVSISTYGLAAEIEILTFAGNATFQGSGNALANRVSGGSLSDSLSGLAGDDTLVGGLGDDTLEGGSGLDTASYAGVSSAYTVYGDGSGGFYVSGTEGFDRLVDVERLMFSDGVVDIAASAVWLSGGTTGDTLAGGVGDDILNGGAGDDLIQGGTGSDVAVFAGRRADYRIFADGEDGLYLQGPDGLDHLVGIEVLRFSDANLATSIPPLDLWLKGTNGKDTLTGNTGDDVLTGGLGDDSLVGGVGTDTARFSGTLAASTVYSDGAGGFIVSGTDGFDRLQGVERLAFDDQTVDAATAASALWLEGTASAETLTGDAGDDVLTGGLGDDSLVGGAGTDTARFSSTLAASTVYSDGAGGYIVSGTDGFDRLQGVERLAFDDQTVDAATAATALWLEGTASAETLTGGNGDDVLTGGLGDDSLVGGSGTDTARFSGTLAASTVYSDGTGGYIVSGTDGFDRLQ
ncbi:beta strand repeat-containing protein, partial [Caulobacter sp. HMWF025]|uniref:beta strand repeat-containing protein n=1 Tax=Caulobacter sp. HMWF025 TaxID=2056860 RepID=UPI00234311B8